MNERPISDILGIQHPGHCPGCECDPWDDPISVDDMLAWLKSLDRCVFISGGSPHTYWQVRVSPPGEYNQRPLYSKSHNAPTLHAALAAAVRAIASEQT